MRGTNQRERLKSSLRASIPLTCGELIQGTLNGTPVLVSAPITTYTMIELQACDGLRLPADARKMRQVLTMVDAAGVRVSVQRGARSGAGYATSTADIVGGLAAWGVWRGQPFSAEELARHAVAIEPSDGIMWPGLTLFAQRDASIVESLGAAPPLFLLVLDPGGMVDTVKWTRRLPKMSLDDSTQRAVSILRDGLLTHDWAAIGNAASMSASAYQAILPSSLVEEALQFAPTIGALGVVRAHSGPIAGFLFANRQEAQDAWPLVAYTFKHCDIFLTMLTGGGVDLKGNDIKNDD